MARTRKPIPHPLRFDVLTRCNYACYYCGVPASLGAVELHIEHVIPFSLGGSDDPWNLVAACWPCNIGKSNIIPPDWLVRQVRDDWLLFSNSRGMAVEQCDNCRIPMWTDPGDDRAEHCGACDQAISTVSQHSFSAGWDSGFAKGEREAIEAFADYIIQQRKGGA